MPAKKDSRVREQELLDEQAQLIADYIRNDPELVKEIQEGVEAVWRGEAVPARDIRKQWQKARTKHT